MFIESIILHNYRAYKGHNKVSFKPASKNIFLIAGIMALARQHFLRRLYGAYMAN